VLAVSATAIDEVSVLATAGAFVEVSEIATLLVSEDVTPTRAAAGVKNTTAQAVLLVVTVGVEEYVYDDTGTMPLVSVISTAIQGAAGAAELLLSTRSVSPVPGV
jgi:hypothetical protein